MFQGERFVAGIRRRIVAEGGSDLDGFRPATSSRKRLPLAWPRSLRVDRRTAESDARHRRDIVVLLHKVEPLPVAGRGAGWQSELHGSRLRLVTVAFVDQRDVDRAVVILVCVGIEVEGFGNVGGDLKRPPVGALRERGQGIAQRTVLDASPARQMAKGGIVVHGIVAVGLRRDGFDGVIIHAKNVMSRPPVRAIEAPQGGGIGIARSFRPAMKTAVHLVDAVGHAFRRQYRAHLGVVLGITRMDRVGEKLVTRSRRVLFGTGAAAQEIIMVTRHGQVTERKNILRHTQDEVLAPATAGRVEPGPRNGLQDGVVLSFP